MRNLILIVWLAFNMNSIHAQITDVTQEKSGRYGIKFSAGLITIGEEATTMINESTLSTQKIKFSGAAPQLSVGFWGQKKFGWLYADANILYTRYGMNYDVFGNNSDDINMRTMSENFEYIDLQVMGGLTANGFRLGVGPVAHILANHHSDLMEVEYFNERMRKISYGFSGAVGYDFKKFSFDIKFDKAFRTIGDHMYYGTRKSRFLETPDALSLSVAYQLF